uniref:Plastid movement impaired protein n=1 Tax=Cannabis sativa TaxID=3483 RepID=A0A803PBK9_CANSA
MGNSLGAKKAAKVMRINGEEFKVKAGIEVGEVVKDYPGHVLLESEAVKHYGTRAKPLDLSYELKAKRLYFLVELPKVTIRENHNNIKIPRRVQSGINMSAKDRLENLMLSRRSVSDLSMMKPTSILPADSPENGTPVRVTMRLRKSEVEKLMQESKDQAEAAEKIVGTVTGTTSLITCPKNEDKLIDAFPIGWPDALNLTGSSKGAATSPSTGDEPMELLLNEPLVFSAGESMVGIAIEI